MDLRRLVDSYFDKRGLAKPNTNEAMLFLTSEIGELADAIVSPQKRWVRNDKTKEDIEDYIGYIAYEIGDVLMMLTVVASTFDLDPITCMQEKMIRKITEMYDED